MKPARDNLAAEFTLAGPSDSTVSDDNPFAGIWTLVARRTLAGRVLGLDQCLTRVEAIRLYTGGAARALRKERV
jgi:predicted amidohydrolase YtcJ